MLGFVILAAALNAPLNPTVYVMLHVPLSGTQITGYQRELRRYGRVTDHVGAGTWTNPHDPKARIVAENVDHIEVMTDLRTALSFLPTFLRLQRIEQNQTETLGEIFGGSYGTAGQTRTRIIVRLPAAQATAVRLDRLHRIFANNGDGGDSFYFERDSVTDYSAVRAGDAASIEDRLTRDHSVFTIEQETFITDDAATR